VRGTRSTKNNTDAPRRSRAIVRILGEFMSQTVNAATAIAAVASRAGTLKAGDTVTFSVTTQSAPTVTGTPKLTLSNGAGALYSGTDANGKLVFTYPDLFIGLRRTVRFGLMASGIARLF
jgi:hypothetical protein